MSAPMTTTPLDRVETINEGRSEMAEMTEVTCERPLWEQVDVEVDGAKGRRSVPAITHEWCHGLAVTMCEFGEFNVTQVSSGRCLARAAYQRFGRACRDLTEWFAIGRLAGVDWTQDGAAEISKKMEAVRSEPVPFDGCTSTGAEGTRPMTVLEWLRSTRSAIPFMDEFPWEAPEDDPIAHADAILDTLAPSAVPAPEPPHA